MAPQETRARIEQAKHAVKSEKTLLDNNEGPFALLNRRQRREQSPGRSDMPATTKDACRSFFSTFLKQTNPCPAPFLFFTFVTFVSFCSKMNFPKCPDIQKI
jgi:hypothetical protein